MTTNTIAQKYDLNSWDRKIFSNKLFWLVFVLIVFTYPIYRSMNRTLPPELPVYFKLPQFEMTNQYGKSFGSKDLNGKIYIANFVFTNCPSSCPALMEKMQKIQKRIRGVNSKASLVTFSVDPENDSPKVLKKFADMYQANPYVWNFLTGEKPQVRSLLVDGFKVTMGDKKPVEFKLQVNKDELKDVTLFDIAHSEKMVLVDDKNQVRGYYNTDKDAINKMMIDVGLLINRHKYNK